MVRRDSVGRVVGEGWHWFEGGQCWGDSRNELRDSEGVCSMSRSEAVLRTVSEAGAAFFF